MIPVADLVYVFEQWVFPHIVVSGAVFGTFFLSVFIVLILFDFIGTLKRKF